MTRRAAAALRCGRWRLQAAARVIRKGGVVAYPTEAVYGLGCDPRNAAAVVRLLEIKRRAPAQGLIVIGADLEQLRPYIGALKPEMRERIERTWPGPTTWLVPAAAGVPRWLRGGHTTIAVRMTAYPAARTLCQAAGMALVSTSANLSGQPPARTALQVRRRFGGALDDILVGAVGARRLPTEIRDARTGRIVRPG